MNFKVGDRVIVINEPKYIWTIVSMEYPHSKLYHIEISRTGSESGICSKEEIRHVMPLEELL